MLGLLINNNFINHETSLKTVIINICVNFVMNLAIMTVEKITESINHLLEVYIQNHFNHDNDQMNITTTGDASDHDQ